MYALLRLVLEVSIIALSFSWKEWDYKVTWSHPGSANTAENNKLAWASVWNISGAFSDVQAPPPRPRRGHSLHIIKTSPLSPEYLGNTYLVMFGGRDNDQETKHIPKTYEVKNENGSIVFTTYDQKPVSACNDKENKYYTKAEQSGCGNNTEFVNIALTYNDVWAYKLCNNTGDNPDRGFDSACNSTGWELWHPGAPQGGCVIELGIEVCTVPSERYNHASVLFDDGCLYVYGGFSERCQDYCDDIWFFDIYLKSWRQIYADGDLTKFYNDTYFEVTIYLNQTDVPVSNSSSKFAGPSKRWRHQMAIGKPYYGLDGNGNTQLLQQFVLHGGHRLWHGFSAENSQDNNWGSYITRPRGGYLDDLWIYTKVLDTTSPASGSFRTNNGLWKQLLPNHQCTSAAQASWDTRNDIACVTVTPPGRASHGLAFDWDRQYIWIFGGYNTYYPYLSTDGIGSGSGVSSVGSGGFVPYPGYEYFRNDLWYFNLHTKIWTQVVIPDGGAEPDGRMDMVFLLLDDDIIFMHGGYADNFVYDDTWYFNITSGKWLEKEVFVHPIYPKNCTDDFEFINDPENKCVHLMWPKHLERTKYYPFDVLPYSEQKYYWPDKDFGPYYGIFPKDWDVHEHHIHNSLKAAAFPPVGTAEFPYAATGTMQYARNFTYEFNASYNATLVKSCTSAYGEPTRGRLNDGLYGRVNGSILIAQPRPQKPGWDGCRDRADARTDLTPGLQYEKPLPRFGHRAIYSSDTKEILFYGGFGYYQEQPKVLNDSWSMTTKSDMWYYNLFHCVNNCSDHGKCIYGFCHCFDGYYGIDCSNISCPGTFCYYDQFTHEQICTHACQAGYNHTDNDTYVQDIAKIPCSLDDPGESNGICDGFGTTMCAPPFIGNDCGTKDCKSNCSFNGWCSIEYPVSRCMCVPGYFGEICEYKLCLNNCSYPNGVCNETTGVCQCNMMYSPYNNTREYKPWAGEDCSYLFAYEGQLGLVKSAYLLASLWFWLLMAVVVVSVSCGDSLSVTEVVQLMTNPQTRHFQESSGGGSGREGEGGMVMEDCS